MVRSPLAGRHPDVERVVRSASPPCPRLHRGGGLSDVYRRLHTSGGVFHAPNPLRHQLRVDAFPQAVVGTCGRMVLPCRKRSGFYHVVPLPGCSALVCGPVWAGHDRSRRTDEPGPDRPFRRIVRDQFLRRVVRRGVQPVRRHPLPPRFLPRLVRRFRDEAQEIPRVHVSVHGPGGFRGGLPEPPLLDRRAPRSRLRAGGRGDHDRGR